MYVKSSLEHSTGLDLVVKNKIVGICLGYCALNVLWVYRHTSNT